MVSIAEGARFLCSGGESPDQGLIPSNSYRKHLNLENLVFHIEY